MKSTPMLMSGPLVVPTLAGLKTHTCRPIRLPRSYEHGEVYGAFVDGAVATLSCDPGPHQQVRCPFGTVGDQIWVRETCRSVLSKDTDGNVTQELIEYRADGKFLERRRPNVKRNLHETKWTPSMNMPEWASRITLEVTSVSVFRVQDITEEIAKREGVTPDDDPCDHPRQSCTDAGCIGREWKGYRAGFAQVWIDIYGRESWAANPWVWGIGLKRVKP